MSDNSIIKKEQNELLTVNNSENYTLIEINEKKYAIKTLNVLEIVKVMELDYSNDLPSCVLGLVKYEDKPISVIDLRDIFKNERIVYDLSAKIIILKTEDTTTSIICDKVLDIKKLNKDKISDVPYESNHKFFDGIYIDHEETVYVLNIENVMSYIKENPQNFQNQNIGQKFLVDDDHSKEILKERKNFLVTVTEDVENTKALYDMGVSFIINDVKYYINMASVKEFYRINNSKFIKVPSTPNYIFGLINIKGDYITVLDIRRFFNNSQTKLKEKSTIIILNSQEYKIGILADEICESMNIDFDEIVQNRLQKEDNKKMEFVKDGEIYQVLDVEKLFQDDRLTIA